MIVDTDFRPIIMLDIMAPCQIWFSCSVLKW
jgi:hypothetical protein